MGRPRWCIARPNRFSRNRVRLFLLWWRRGESNSGPKRAPDGFLQAQWPIESRRAVVRSPTTALPADESLDSRLSAPPRGASPLNDAAPRREEDLGWACWNLWVTQQGHTARRTHCRQLVLTVPLFSVARRPRPACHLRPTLSKPVAPMGSRVAAGGCHPFSTCVRPGFSGAPILAPLRSAGKRS